MSTYLYGVVRAPSAPPPPPGKLKARTSKRGPAPLPERGVGNPPAPVRLVTHGDLAAVVSDVPDDYHAEAEGLRGMRRDMRAHAAVVNEWIASATVLPFRFG